MPEVYSDREVASASGRPVEEIRRLIETGHVIACGGYIAEEDAVRLVRRLTGRGGETDRDRAPLTLVRETRRRHTPALLTSGALHAALVLLLVLIPALGWLAAHDTEELVRRDDPVRLVFLQSPGPGGGGGGGGLRNPTPPPPARRRAPEPVIDRSPVPPVRTVARPPRPTPPRPLPAARPVALPVVVDAPAPILPQAIVAPVVPIAGDAVDLAGLPVPAAPPAPPSLGPGTGGGVGSGQGAGLGAGDGGGIGSGSGGGTGGGPFRPGSGIEPPVLVREVRPGYTADARRRGVEGEVVLEIVVGRNGRVGNIRVLQRLGAGLDEKAVEAVRRWQFDPAKRQGSPVDVVVTVAVGFTLR